MRIRLLRLAEIDLDPRTLMAKVPFVVLVIAALGLGLGVTLWLSTDAAERSYELGHARQTNEALLQQKEALERQVLEAAGRARTGRGGPQPRHDPVSRHRASRAGSRRELDRGRQPQTRAGGAAATAERQAAR